MMMLLGSTIEYLDTQNNNNMVIHDDYVESYGN